MARSTNDRIIGVLGVGLGCLGLVWARCAWLQLAAARRITALVEAQQRTTDILRARRGALLDRAGHPLAISVIAPSVFADARGIVEKTAMARQLARAVGRDARMIERRLERDKRFVWIARQVDPAVTPAVLTLQEEGVGIVEEPKRLYPHGGLGRHVLGAVDIDQHGLEGLELALNGILQGRDGRRSTLRDAKGNLLIGPWTTQVEPADGHDAVLTIDGVVQGVAEDVLAWGVKKHHAKGGSIIVMEPSTGAIAALANAHAYVTDAAGAIPADRRRNRAVTDVFEPGSVFKIVTASALLEEGRIGPEEPIFCEDGSYRVSAGHVIHDHEPRGTLPFRDVIKWSSNIGTAKAAQRLTPDELYRHIRAFGFGEPTGVDLPGEVGGLLSPPARWSKLSPFILPFGQEVAVTPMQLAVMTAVIANGGLRVRPYLVERIQTAEGRVLRTHQAAAPVRVLSPATAAMVQEILTSVVESGTGKLAGVQGLTAAGKTGTAQKLEPTTGRYSHSRYVASFVGFVPVPDSRFVIVVSIDEPRPVYFGGQVSAPMFRRLVEQLSGYWQLERAVPPKAIAQRP